MKNLDAFLESEGIENRTGSDPERLIWIKRLISNAQEQIYINTRKLNFLDNDEETKMELQQEIEELYNKIEYLNKYWESIYKSVYDEEAPKISRGK